MDMGGTTRTPYISNLLLINIELSELNDGKSHCIFPAYEGPDGHTHTYVSKNHPKVISSYTI